MKRGKKYVEASKLIDASKVYALNEAVELVKKTSTVKFDATVDVSIRLNVDPRQADQQVRGTIVLPHGNGKTKKVLAITNKIDEAKEAGADIVGGKEMIEKIIKGLEKRLNPERTCQIGIRPESFRLVENVPIKVKVENIEHIGRDI